MNLYEKHATCDTVISTLLSFLFDKIVEEYPPIIKIFKKPQ